MRGPPKYTVHTILAPFLEVAPNLKKSARLAFDDGYVVAFFWWDKIGLFYIEDNTESMAQFTRMTSLNQWLV